jgi:hypothetical protein
MGSRGGRACQSQDIADMPLCDTQKGTYLCMPVIQLPFGSGHAGARGTAGPAARSLQDMMYILAFFVGGA